MMAQGTISQMAASRDGKIVYGHVQWQKITKQGDQEIRKDFRCLFAEDSASGKRLWTIGGVGQERQWDSWVSISDGRLYCSIPVTDTHREKALTEIKAYFQQHSPERLKDFDPSKRTIQAMAALEGTTGRILYEAGIDTTNVFLYSGRRGVHYNPSIIPFTMASDNTVVFATQSGADKGWRQWPNGAYKPRTLTVYAGDTGKLLWSKHADYRTRPVIANGTIYAEPWGYDIQTGERRQRTHPVTGRKALFVNENFTTRIDGLKPRESEALLKMLYDHIATPEFHCRFAWREKSVAFWDNRCTQHHAVWDYWPNSRYGERVSIVGDQPPRH
jgi:hypothetical protein